MAALVLVRNFEVRKTKTQSNYGSLRINLGCAREFCEIDAKIWDLDVAVANGLPLPACTDLLEVDYQADEFNGKEQWIIRRYRRLDGEEREAALARDFRPQVRIDREFYMARLEGLIEETDPQRVTGRILRDVFDHAEFREAFCLAPAARDHHQNYPGGLLEHTINVTTLALALAESYAAPGRPGLTFNQLMLPIDRQVLIASGLLHDIGKVDTYKFDPLPELTPANQWEGHLPIGYATVRAMAQPMLAAPPYAGAADELNKILHCILSHHGTLEFGSPVVPACAEAFFLSQADITDARVAEIAEMGHAVLAKEPGCQWLPRNFHFRGGLFIGDWERILQREDESTPA